MLRTACPGNGMGRTGSLVSTDYSVAAPPPAFGSMEGTRRAVQRCRRAVSDFDQDRKQYDGIPVREPIEVAALTGDVAVGPDGQAAIHAHAVFGQPSGAAGAGAGGNIFPPGGTCSSKAVSATAGARDT